MMKIKHLHRPFSISVIPSFYMMGANYTSSYKAKVDSGRRLWEFRHEFSEQNLKVEHTNSGKYMEFLCNKDPRCTN